MQLSLFRQKKSLSFVISFFFIFSLVVFNLGCATDLTSPIQSGIDADFKFKKLNRNNSGTESETIGFYQKTLRSASYSECEYFPSDSVYSQTMSKRCGSFASLLKTFSRFILESDAANLGVPIRPTQGKYRFIDLPETCEIF